MSDLFQTEDQTVTPGKYDSWDLDALKRKAEAADEHIRAIESENRALRESSDTSTTLEEILERLDQSKSTPPNFLPSTGANQPPSERTSSSESIKKEDVAAMIAAALDNNQKQSLAQSNVNTVKSKLAEVWGADYQKKVTEKAKEINIPQDTLSALAETSPAAFLKLVLDEKPVTNPNSHLPPSTMVRALPNQSKPMEKWSDFSKAMKENPSLRMNASFQKLLHETAERIGSAFY